MTDTPLDLDAIRWRAERTAEMPLPGPRLTFVLNKDIPALLAEVRTLRTQLAEAQLEATKLATEGEWSTQYGHDSEHGWIWEPRGINYASHERQVWCGPPTLIKWADGDQA